MFDLATKELLISHGPSVTEATLERAQRVCSAMGLSGGVPLEPPNVHDHPLRHEAPERVGSRLAARRSRPNDDQDATGIREPRASHHTGGGPRRGI